MGFMCQCSAQQLAADRMLGLSEILQTFFLAIYLFLDTITLDTAEPVNSHIGRKVYVELSNRH